MARFFECPFRFILGINFQWNCSIVDVINIAIALSGLYVAIYHFRKQNQKNREMAADQNKKNWYLSVLVIPQIEKINAFFEEIVKMVKAKKKNEEKKLIVIAEDQISFKEKVEAFFSPLEAAISSYDPQLRSKVSGIELDLQDEITT